MVAVQPDTHIVDPIVAWVTAGLRAPGVRLGLGSPGNRPPDPVPVVGGRTPVAFGANEAPADPELSSSESGLDACGEGDAETLGTTALGDFDAAGLSDDEAFAPADNAAVALVEPEIDATPLGVPVAGPLGVAEEPVVSEQPPMAATATRARTAARPAPTRARRDTSRQLRLLLRRAGSAVTTSMPRGHADEPAISHL